MIKPQNMTQALDFGFVLGIIVGLGTAFATFCGFMAYHGIATGAPWF